jgi:hypothetical protein
MVVATLGQKLPEWQRLMLRPFSKWEPTTLSHMSARLPYSTPETYSPEGVHLRCFRCAEQHRWMRLLPAAATALVHAAAGSGAQPCSQQPQSPASVRCRQMLVCQTAYFWQLEQHDPMWSTGQYILDHYRPQVRGACALRGCVPAWGLCGQVRSGQVPDRCASCARSTRQCPTSHSCRAPTPPPWPPLPQLPRTDNPELYHDWRIPGRLKVLILARSHRSRVRQVLNQQQVRLLPPFLLVLRWGTAGRWWCHSTLWPSKPGQRTMPRCRQARG